MRLSEILLKCSETVVPKSGALSKKTESAAITAADSKVRAWSWDKGMCPWCMSERVKETSYCDMVGESSYKCLNCGADGYGMWGGDTEPTIEQVKEYERRFNK